MKPCYNIFPFNVFLPPSFSLKSPSWRVGRQCCCHIKFSHIKSSENLLLIGRITKKILTCLKWSKSGRKSREGNREDPSGLQLPPFPWWSLGISERGHTLQAERGVSTTRHSWAPAETAAGKGAAAPWEKLTTLDPRAHAPRFSPFSVFGDVEREQEGGNRKLENANWITLSDFILQFYTNIFRG